MLWEELKEELEGFDTSKNIALLNKKYESIIKNIEQNGAYIWGTGFLGRHANQEFLKAGIKVLGFIDNNKKDEKNGIYGPDILTESDAVVIASVKYPDIQAQIKGKTEAIYYELLALIYNKNLGVYGDSFKCLFSEIEENKQEYIRLYSRLSDEESKKVYIDLMKYKMTMEAAYTKSALEISSPLGECDYDIVIMDKLEGSPYTLFDCGGFDGDSAETFVNKVSKYQAVYIFEPDSDLMSKAKNRLNKFPNINYINKGVGSRNETLYYKKSKPGAGKFTDGGTEEIQIVTLDDYIKDEHSFIKMDIEGLECEALEGATNAIRKYKPIMSISAYHKSDDYRKIINQVLTYNPDYKIYIRHYTNTYTETRIYFI